MGTKGWIIFGAVAVAVLGGMIFFSNQNKLDVSSYDANNIIAAVEDNGMIGDNVFGNKDSKVVLIEYGDFQCPGCGSAHPRIKALTEKYEDDIAFVYRNLPLTSAHPNARVAAASAQAAGLQGKYWEMHNILFENQEAWSGASTSDRNNIFRGYAERIGLDLAKFDTDVASTEVAKKINFDLALAKKVEASSTPSFFLNGKAVEQDVWESDEKLEEFILSKLREAGIEPKTVAEPTATE